MSDAVAPRVIITTAPQPGAVAIVQLQGPGSAALLAKLTDAAPPPGRLRLGTVPDIDDALLIVLRDDWCQIMPHGGPRVVRRLLDRLLDLGAVYDADPDPRATYPEAQSPIEADVLAAIARAASPAAIDLLAAQPALWRDLLANQPSPRPGPIPERADIQRRSDVLDRLIHPPTVVVVGQPNVGKSTLTNTMLGRAVSLVADLPGTTRDWVAGIAELSQARDDSPTEPSTSHTEHAHVAVQWLDTPGLRTSTDPIEQHAITLARQVIAAADVLIAMRDPEIDWPNLAPLPRIPDLYVMNKMDDPADPGASGTSVEDPLPISARTDRGLNRLQSLILNVLELDLDHLTPPPRWAFSDTLRAALHDRMILRRYV